MPASINATLGAGTCLRYEDQSTPGTYIDIEEALSIFEVGDNEGGVVDITPICSPEGQKEVIEGEGDPKEVEIVLNDKPGKTDYADYITLVMAKTENVTHQVEFSNGRIATFDLSYLGFRMNETERGAQLQATVKASQVTDITWSTAP